MSLDRDAVFAHIESHLDSHIHHIQRWVRQPSVSWHGHGVKEMATIVAESFEDLGCTEVELLEGRFEPGVWAYLDEGAPITVHTYGMFDTRTVEPGSWKHDPWGAELVERESGERILVGRGALGAKGPFVAFLNALKSYKAVMGRLPVNIMFLAEGEEILGSPTYRQHVERYRDRLEEASASYCPSPAQSGSSTVGVGLGLKGMVVVEITVSGADWSGAPTYTIHSSAASLVNSPPFRLAQALSTLTEPDGSGCRVPELKAVWKHRQPLSPRRQELLEALAERSRGSDWRDVLPVGGKENVDRLLTSGEGIDPLVDFLYGPTFNVAGLRSGFLGPNTGTIPFIVPAVATATIDIRTVIEMPADEIVAAIRRHLDGHGFEDVQIDVLAAFDSNQTDPDHPIVAAAQSTLQAWSYSPSVWPIQAGGGPWTAVPNALGIPCLRGSVPGGGSGGNDEYLAIDDTETHAGLATMEKVHVDLLSSVADALTTARTDEGVTR